MTARCALAALLVLALSCATNAAKQHKYKENEKIILWANKGEWGAVRRSAVAACSPPVRA